MSGYSLLAPINIKLKMVWCGKGVMPFGFAKHTKKILKKAKNTTYRPLLCYFLQFLERVKGCSSDGLHVSER